MSKRGDKRIALHHTSGAGAQWGQRHLSDGAWPGLLQQEEARGRGAAGPNLGFAAGLLVVNPLLTSSLLLWCPHAWVRGHPSQCGHQGRPGKRFVLGGHAQQGSHEVCGGKTCLS